MLDEYSDLRKATNAYHNAGIQRSIDGDKKGALKCFELRDEIEKKIEEMLSNAGVSVNRESMPA